ncbi:MAG: cold-shock protein [Planctomycetota bacterium]|jgi:CspA family cold shock protein
MATGVVKWFDPKKGFGFVLNDKGEDVFVHYSCIEGDGFRCLRTGQKVSFDETSSGKGLQATSIQFLDDESVTPEDEQEAEAVS